MIVHGTPRSRATHAMPCAQLPALAVNTPFSSSASGASRKALMAPRILERCDRLKVFELQKDLLWVLGIVQLNERRSDGPSLDGALGVSDGVDGNHRSCVPRLNAPG